MKEFVPIPDDFPLETLCWPGVLVPYRFGMRCHHALDATARNKAPGVLPAAPSAPVAAPRESARWLQDPREQRSA